MILRGLALILAAVAALAAAPSRACSLLPGYPSPTNFELVQLAGAIVIASAEEGYGGEMEPGIVFRTQSILKGDPPERLRIGGVGLGVPRGRSSHTFLSTAHPDSYSGACNRTTFARGGRYLLFLQRGADGAWHRLPFAFARISEDYSGEDNPWMRSVRRYLRLQQTLPPMEQIAALARLAETRHDEQGRRLPAPERRDILTHLLAISPWKPTAWLLDLYGRSERGEPISFALGGPAPINPTTLSTRTLEEVLEGAPGNAPAPRFVPAELVRQYAALAALAQGDHPDALPLVERLFAAPETDRRLRGPILLYLARNGRFPVAYRWIEQHMLAQLSAMTVEEADSFLFQVSRAMAGDSWEEGQERWRGDPHAAATWPALARRIHARQVALLGADRAYPFYDLEEPQP